MKCILVMSGPIGAGKSEFSAALERDLGAVRVSTRKYILDVTRCENERRALQEAGDRLDVETEGRWVADAVEKALSEGLSADIALLDSARIAPQLAALRQKFGEAVFHVHLTADRGELERRYKMRRSELREFATYEEAANQGTEREVGNLATIADLVLHTDHEEARTLARAAAAWRGLTTAKKLPQGLVDVIVGGQYGSEGKGNICAHIAGRYDALVRIGGPNAGHKVKKPEYTYVQLPSGTGSNPKAEILIGAGSTIWLPRLLKEIYDLRLDEDRISIDPQAMIILDYDQEVESKGLQNISTTGKGVGSASARKILNRGNQTFGPAVRLARDVEEIKPFVRNVRKRLNAMMEEGKRILLEGTQGTMLSIHHGIYPHVTSRETSVAGCLADAGLASLHVGKVIMVLRTYPIRVGGNSGWIGAELTYQELSKRSRISQSELETTEKGSVSGKQRRLAEFDWGQLRQSVELNGATEIALTFADYLGIANRSASSFDELSDVTKQFIERIERVAGVPVTLVSKDFAEDGVIERVVTQ